MSACNDVNVGHYDYADKEIQEIARSTSHLEIDLLLCGETGSGKDTLAKRIHVLSKRKGGFIAMNCAAIPETLAESELFGVVSGAYTGANRSRMGYIEAAHGGTLYLDEIDSMPINLQAKLLRVLEIRGIERLGSTTFVPVELRVIASAQRPLDELVEQGVFRRDLYFRLNVLTIRLPALRERREQILPLFHRFVREDCAILGREPPSLNPHLMQLLLGHAWPGNVRELKSAAKRFSLGFPLLDSTDAGSDEAMSLKLQMRTIERILIKDAMKRHKHSIEAVSLELGLPLRTLYHRIKSLDVMCKAKAE